MIQTETKKRYEVKVKYPNVVLGHTVTEVYCVSAFSFAEAEEKVMDAVSEYVDNGGAVDVQSIVKLRYADFVHDDNEEADLPVFKVGMSLVTVDEKSGKEKKSHSGMLVRAKNITAAKAMVDDVMKKSVSEYKITFVTETPILDVL